MATCARWTSASLINKSEPFIRTAAQKPHFLRSFSIPLTLGAIDPANEREGKKNTTSTIRAASSSLARMASPSSPAEISNPAPSASAAYHSSINAGSGEIFNSRQSSSSRNGFAHFHLPDEILTVIPTTPTTSSISPASLGLRQNPAN